VRSHCLFLSLSFTLLSARVSEIEEAETQSLSFSQAFTLCYTFKKQQQQQQQQEEEEERIMKILRKNEGLLSNFEMCELLKQRELKRHEGVLSGDEENNEENVNNNNSVNAEDDERHSDLLVDNNNDEDEEDEDEEFVPLYPTPHAPFETEILMLKEFKEKGVRVGKQEREKIEKFIQFVEPVGLTMAETLMLINLKPRGKKKRAIVKAIVESCQERMNADEVDDLLTLVRQTLL